MERINYSKNVKKASDVVLDLFASNEDKFGQIVICNSIDEPGIYIYTENQSTGERKIQKVNGVENIILNDNVDPTATGEVSSGDTLIEMVSKLQNQINSIVDSGDTGNTKVNNIVAGVGLNDDGTYSAITGDYVATATSIANAIELLDAAIGTVSDATLDEAKVYTDAKVTEAVEALDSDVHASDGEVFTDIVEIDGIVSGDVKALTVVKDSTGLKYDLKLGDYVYGTIDIPQDQFLEGVTFISAATVEDVAEALSHGQHIELGKPYLKFVWKLEGGVVSPTYVDVSGLIDVYTAADVKLSDAYSGTSFDIKSGVTLEDAVGKITNELTEIEGNINVTKITSPEKTIVVVSGESGTTIDVNIDNDTIVADQTVASQGKLSVALDVDKQHIDSGYVRTKYTLKSTNGEYGVINDTREVFDGDSDGFINVATAQVSDAEGNRTDKITITPVIQKVVNNATSESIDDGNGFVTAWGVKSYIRDGLDGDGIMVGDDNLLQYHPFEFWRGKINFDSQSLEYDTVHEAFYKTDNNMELLDRTIGLAYSGQTVHLYPSASTQECLLIKDDRTIMDALKTLDKAIDDMDWTGTTNENQVFTSITQTNGHVSATCENIANVKLADYEVVQVANPSASTAKVATTDTLGQGLGKLQGQINAMDYNANTDVDKVFTSIEQIDGRISTSGDLITKRIITGYQVGTDTKIAATDSLGGALGKLQGQIDALDYTANTSTDQVFTYVGQKDGKLTLSAQNITDRVITGYEVQSITDPTATASKIAATDKLGVALGKVQGQINSMDYTANTNNSKVFTYVAQADGKMTTSGDLLTNRVIEGYTVGADTSGKIAATDTLGQALGKLQGQVNGMDLGSSADTNQVITDVTQTDGKISHVYSDVTTRKLRGYGTTADTKVTSAQTLGAALGNLQGQINSLDYTANTATDKVFTYIGQADGKLTLSADTVGNRILSDYVVGSDAKLANTDSVKGAFGKLQGQINAMDYTANTSTDKVFTYIAEADGKVSVSADTVGNRILSDYVVGSDAKVAATDSVKGAIGKLQGQINALDYTANTSTDKVFTYIGQADGKLTLSADNITNRIITGYAVGSDAKLAATDSVGGAFGKLQGQIDAMDKDSSSAVGMFVRTVIEEDGKVSEVRDVIRDTDVKITAATVSDANVKEAWKLVNKDGTQLGSTIKIYKDSSIVEIYLGTSADTINASTGAIDKKSGDKESLNYAYYTVNGTYSMTKINLEDFLTEPEFKSGVTVTNHIAHGVVDTTNSEKVVTGYTAAGAANGTAAVLSVDGSGFKVSNIQTAINAKVNNAISLLDSSSAASSNYALTSITLADGKIAGIGQTNKISSAATADNADKLDGYHLVVGTTGNTANTIYIL